MCVCVCVRVRARRVCVYLITGQKLSSFRRCPNGRLSRVILGRPINKLVSATECVLQFHVHNGFFSSLYTVTENPYETFGKINTCDVEHGLCARRPPRSDVYYEIHYTYSRFAISSHITMMVSWRVYYVPQLYHYIILLLLLCCTWTTTLWIDNHHRLYLN